MENSGGTLMPSPELLDTVARLATDALAGLACHDMIACDAAMTRLITEFGPYMGSAMLAWCDFTHVCVAKVASTPEETADMFDDTFRTFRIWRNSAPEQQWAARMLKARTDQDSDAFLAGIDTINELTGRDAYDHTMALLKLCAAVCTCATVAGLVCGAFE